ncbi:sensor domain-containing protein [Thetidibacter halocola]|uniref:EAL domain-containing protein n=1 Tax=Thetidibacter halocola TaxID=2827239 RepID=A0A8J7WFD4_9RHOB|nr:bifunctional diguanylate cyclase/phosphodiesterase [Thetidibacter halocola]MBS0125369.1 EAL domain-containing protein [Thetidibacter halocola]
MTAQNDRSEYFLAASDLSDARPLMFLVADGDGRITRVSDDWLTLVGCRRDDVIGRPATEFVSADDGALLGRDGTRYDCTVSTSVLTGLDGAPCGHLAIVQGTDGRDLLVDRLRIKSHRLQSCLEATQAATWEWNVQTGETHFNDRWAEIIGYQPDELGPVSIDTWISLAHPDDLVLSTEALERHWRGETEFYDIEARMRHKDGHWVWVHDCGRVFSRTAQGEPEWMFGTHFSLEEQKRRQRETERMHRLLTRTGAIAGIGGWELDLETNALTWTEETRRIHGVNADYVPTVEDAITFYAPEARATIARAVERAMADGTPWDLELPFIRRSGEHIWVRAIGEVEIREGLARCLFGAFQDVTERVLRDQELDTARQAAQQAQERLWAAFEALPEAFVLYDADDRAVLFNEKYRQTYSESGGAIEIGQRFEDILREGLRKGQYPEAIGREQTWLKQRLELHRNPLGPLEQELPGDRHLKIHEVRLPNGDTVGFRVDVTQLKRQKAELKQKARALEIAATTDPLTGLHNRRGLESVMQDLTSWADEDDRFGLLHVDLDRFKPINDVFGHPAGDFLLRRVADILKSTVRSGDFVSRIGGDEFVAVLNAPCSDEAAQDIAQRIIRCCGEPVCWGDKTLRFGASVGVALGSVADLPRMLIDADIALYEAKKGGRNCHHVFNAALRRKVEDRKALSDDLLVGLQRGEIVAHYQPQLRAADLSLVGIEALARWHHPDRGVLQPADFFAIAEELGMMPEIDRLVCDQAIETGHAIASAGHALATVSVNAGLPRLTQARDFDWLPATRDFPFRLSVEVLETVDVDRDFDEIAWVFDDLRERGIRVEIDDFGSGRASLTALLKIRPDRIKLDTQIVRAALFDPTGAGSMMRAIAEMCRGLGIPMTAEGIETRKHANLMRDVGCDILQGFHFAHPLPHESLMDWAHQWRPDPAPPAYATG